MVRWQAQRRVQMLAERTEGSPLIRPRIINVEDIRPVALVQRPRLRAYEQMKFLVGLKLLSHFRNDPGPEPVCTGRAVRVVCQEIYRYSHHRYLPALPRLPERSRSAVGQGVSGVTIAQKTFEVIASAVIRD